MKSRAQFDRARAASAAVNGRLPGSQPQLNTSLETLEVSKEKEQMDENFFMAEMVRMRKLIATRESEIEAYRQRVVTDMDSLQTEIDLLEESRLEYKKNATLVGSPSGAGATNNMSNRNNVGDDVQLQFKST